MGYSPWGPKRVRHDLVIKQHQTHSSKKHDDMGEVRCGYKVQLCAFFSHSMTRQETNPTLPRAGVLNLQDLMPNR